VGVRERVRMSTHMQRRPCARVCGARRCCVDAEAEARHGAAAACAGLNACCERNASLSGLGGAVLDERKDCVRALLASARAVARNRAAAARKAGEHGKIGGDARLSEPVAGAAHSHRYCVVARGSCSRRGRLLAVSCVTSMLRRHNRRGCDSEAN
jgi:hypothetical protein